MAGSTAPVVREYLRAKFSTALGFDAKYAVGNPDTMGRRWVACGSVVGEPTDYPTMRSGRQRRDERYVLRWHAVVVGTGKTPEVADTEAHELLAAMQTVVADCAGAPGIATAADQQVIGIYDRGWESGEGPMENIGYGFEYVLLVGVHARLL